MTRGAASAAAATSSWKHRKQSNPPGTQVSGEARAARRLLYRFQDGLRDIQAKRVAMCGRVRVSPLVPIHFTPSTGRAHFGGLATCASVWACPVCSAIIRARRADEVREVVEKHGAERTYMASFTVRHGGGDQLKPVRQGVASAFRRVIRGSPWKRFCKRHGLVGCIRALEVTHGEQHGWHPHLHVLLLLGRRLTETELALATDWLAQRWKTCVERELGPEHRPDRQHGTKLTPCHAADYLSKLGLELTAPGRTKRAKNGNRTPMEIAYDFAMGKTLVDAKLWRDYCDSMFRARMLTWSRGLRERFALGEEPTDEELVEETDSESFVAALVAGAEWDKLRDVPGAKAALLERVEAAAPTESVAPTPPSRVRGSPPMPRRPSLIGVEAGAPKGARYLSRAERKVLTEELRHHLVCDLGRIPPQAGVSGTP